MEKFVLFMEHDYMDEYPNPMVRTFKGESLAEIEKHAKQYEHHMNINYSGGTTKFQKIFTAEEALDFLNREIDGWEKDDYLVNLYNKCYK